MSTYSKNSLQVKLPTSFDLDIETVSLLVEGDDGVVVQTSIFLEDQENASIEHVVSFKDLLEEFVDANTIPTNPKTTTDKYTYHLNKTFDDMIAIIEEKRAIVNSLKKWEPSSTTIKSKVKEKSKKQKSKKVSKK